MNRKKIKCIKSIPLLTNQYVNFHKDIIELPDGTRTEYYLTNRGGKASFVLPVDTRGRILVLYEYRYPVGRHIIGPVGGSVEEGETPLRAARRELREEAGIIARRYRLLGTFYAGPAKSDTLFYAYVAMGLTPGQPQPDIAEYVECRWYTLAELERLIRHGEVRDPYLLAIYSLYRLKYRHRLPS